jgi:hypothetical protein
MCPVQPFGYGEKPYPFVRRAQCHEQPHDLVPAKVPPQMIEVPEGTSEYLPTLFAFFSEGKGAFSLDSHAAALKLWRAYADWRLASGQIIELLKPPLA